MRNRQLNYRFFILISVLLIGLIALIFALTRKTTQLDTIVTTNTSYSQHVDAVLVRNESVLVSNTTVRSEYIAVENSYVNAGDEIVYLYANGYTENLLTRLQSTRAQIQEYHKQLLGNIVDAGLDRCDEIVDLTADGFRTLAVNETKGSLRFSIDQLKVAMLNRQEYLRSSKRDDTKLSKLYDEENTRQTSMQSWRTVSTAEYPGVVSFYLDGYEDDISVDRIDSINDADLRTVLEGGTLGSTQDIRNHGIYRIVDQNTWYVAVRTKGDDWNPIVDQQYFLRFDGYDDLSFTATVTNVQKAADMLNAFLRVDAPLGPLIYLRSGKANLSITLDSMAVSVKAITTVNGQSGVLLFDTPEGTFVPVEVLSEENGMALIEPIVAGSLIVGQTVLIK